MSRSKVRKFVKTPLVRGFQRRRASRHGKPQVMRKRVVKQQDSGKIVVACEWVPVPETGYECRVAGSGTGPGGQKNVPAAKKPW